MYRRLLAFLRCPECGQRLDLVELAPKANSSDDELSEGLLHCGRRHWYPVVRGIPRMLPDALEEHWAHVRRRIPDPIPEELRSLMHGQQTPLLIDLRGTTERTADGRTIPGAQALDLAQVERRVADFPRDRDIVFYCNCPNEASAAVAAKALHDLGYARVRPLLGGLEAWVAAGYELEPVARTPG